MITNAFSPYCFTHLECYQIYIMWFGLCDELSVLVNFLFEFSLSYLTNKLQWHHEKVTRALFIWTPWVPGSVHYFLYLPSQGCICNKSWEVLVDASPALYRPLISYCIHCYNMHDDIMMSSHGNNWQCYRYLMNYIFMDTKLINSLP